MITAFFDIDGTLVNATSEHAFFKFLLKNKKIGLKQWLSLIGFTALYFPRYGKHLPKKNKAYLNGLSVNEISTLADYFVKTELVKDLRPEIVERLNQHRENTDHVVLLSGTLFYIAEALKNYLKADAVIATQCSKKLEHFTAAAPLSHPFDKAKLSLAQAYCVEHHLSLNNSYAYGDSHYDISLLSHCQHPVAVYPDDKLAKMAKEKGWEIIDALV